jgi:hypothetical protein
MADQHCTRCHSDLTAHLKEDRPPNVAATVTRFDATLEHHPEFRSVHNTDPGRLEFSHARHLRLGMASDKGGPVQALRMLRKPDRARYQRYAQGTEGFIQLDCAACHQLDPQDSGSSAKSGTTPSSGAYMLPMTYENQCRACHLLEYPSGTPGSLLAHGLQPSEVHSSLWQTFSAEFLNENPALLDQPIPPRPMPGKVEPSEIPKARQVIAGRVEKAENILFGEKKCAECHHYEDGNKNPVPVLKRWDPAHEVRITPPNIQAVWWRSAAFEHSAHRGVSCRGCHEAAYPDSPLASHRSKDVLLPSKEVCLQCHAPRRNGSDAKTVSGGAGFDCTECHRYHNGDAALQGLIASPGAESRSPIGQFLLGAPAATRR